jgi:hypothetical protein
MKLTTHLCLVPRLRMCGAIIPLPNMPQYCGAMLKHRDNFTLLHSCLPKRKSQDTSFALVMMLYEEKENHMK